ncbi:MAG: GNAT family N-acetyltransferase [Candidatus Cohnella colombiensis]|uniref:GNAT family N-acetyltransferase n=1 Tax=Candidatus Cohnella colombiensis TaxID=3121368 RepID=A0AA95EZV6_9BACL|nr:MAG: GNAT family N-acetyltransferase [Cohnella sp.]
MITYQTMHKDQAHKLLEIDRSEYIDLIYEIRNGKLLEIHSGHECPTWTKEMIEEIQERFLFELDNGGMVVGALDEDRLIGFGVLAHKIRGRDLNQLQVDLMYVTRNYRRQGIGTRIINLLREEAIRRGAKFLYISSTETRSAVSFYKSNGSKLTNEIDEELYRKEPKDIHMLIEL